MKEEDIEFIKELIKSGVRPGTEPKLIEIYLKYMGNTDTFKDYKTCYCHSYMRIFVKELKNKYNI